MSEELNPNWFEITIPRNRFLNLEDWESQRNSYFEILRSKISPLVQELKASGLISSWHILTHNGLDLRLLLQRSEDLPKITEFLRKHGIESDLKPWERKKSESGEDRVLEFLSEATLELIDHVGLTKFLLSSGPIHYISNQLGLGNFGEAELYLKLSQNWFVDCLMKSGDHNKLQSIEEAFQQVIKRVSS